MQNTVDTYVEIAEEPLMGTPSDDEDGTETLDIEAQQKYHQLQERYIALKAMTESLREQICREKEQWAKELKATVEMQAQFRNRHHECGDSAINKEYKKKVELFNEFIRFQKNSENLENMVRRKKYQMSLSDVETKCSLELLKIKESMTLLKPLRDIASRWENENVYERIERKSSIGSSSEGSLIAETASAFKELNEIETYSDN